MTKLRIKPVTTAQPGGTKTAIAGSRCQRHYWHDNRRRRRPTPGGERQESHWKGDNRPIGLRAVT